MIRRRAAPHRIQKHTGSDFFFGGKQAANMVYLAAMRELNGVIAIWKPRGPTSHDVVATVRRLLGGSRVGHAGTLDPMAEGVLVLLIGTYTKRQREFLDAEKEYIAAIRLGETSPTDDAEGEIRPSGKPIPERPAIERALAEFRGVIEQVPPDFSAVKIRGRKAYELARSGHTPHLKPKSITIRELEIIHYEKPDLELYIVCSRGTYIRAIARDLGQELGCGGHLTALTRTRSGNFTRVNALNLASLSAEVLRHSVQS